MRKGNTQLPTYLCSPLSAPDFVRSLEDGDYVYFFFREQAVEYINCGKVITINSYFIEFK